MTEIWNKIININLIVVYHICRRNWKKRFFVLKDTTLSYYTSDANDAKFLGKIEIKGAK